MIIVLTDGCIEACLITEKQQVPEMKESLLECGNHSPNLKGAAAWLAGRVTPMPQQEMDLPKEEDQSDKTQKFSINLIDSWATTLGVRFCPQ